MHFIIHHIEQQIENVKKVWSVYLIFKVLVIDTGLNLYASYNILTDTPLISVFILGENLKNATFLLCFFIGLIHHCLQ